MDEPNERNWQRRVDHALFGNGKDGLIVRVDRLEQSRLADKDRWALYSAVAFGCLSFLGTIVPPILDWLGKNI